MVRALGTFGLAALFLAISPALRGTLVDGFGGFEHTMQLYSPLSYVGLGLAIIVFLMFCVYRASQPRI